MLKKNKTVLIITSLVILLPILAGLLLWNRLPEQIPVHWNAQGVVDGWCSKPFAVFILPLILLAAQWLCVLATLTDPKNKSHSAKIFHLVLWIIPTLSAVVHAITYATALGMEVKIERILPLFVGLLFAIIGNYLPKCKQSYTIGIKLPWTLSSEENWNKTHRLAGKLWVACGILIMLLSFMGLGIILFTIVIIMVLIPTVYSYLLYRKANAD